MDGPHTTYNTLQPDLDMIPLVDIGVDTIKASPNRNGNDGFVPGDILDISCRVSNNVVEAYDGGGQLSINWMDAWTRMKYPLMHSAISILGAHKHSMPY